MAESLDPLETSEHIRATYLRYLRTTFPIQDPILRQQYEQELARPGRLVKGPLLEATPPFVSGKSIRELIADGILHPDFALLDSSECPIDRPLYHHQQRAIEKIVRDERNSVIATGTGSGKTEGFLLPIFDWLIKEREQGTLGPGVRALLLYPMNALANDQLKRLRRLLSVFPDITFGRYTGETLQERDKAQAQFQKQFGTDPQANELICRDEMRENPPHILLTNYAMLEYLLIRPDDCELFGDLSDQRFWKFIVMDEAHVYSGASGIELAMLLRRLKDRVVKSEAGALRCIATSATLGGGEGDFPDVARFAQSLFGEPFEYDFDDHKRQDVIAAKRAPVSSLGTVWGEGSAGLYKTLKHSEYQGRPQKELTEDFIKICQDWDMPETVWQSAVTVCQDISDDAEFYSTFLYSILKGDGNVHVLREMLETRPYLITEAAQRIFKHAPEGEAAQSLIDLVDIAVRAKPEHNSMSLLPVRYHLFARALEGAFISLAEESISGPNEEPKIGHRLFLERREICKVGDGEARVAELAVCRRCGQEFLTGSLKDGIEIDAAIGHGKYFRPSSLELTTREKRAYFLWNKVSEGEVNDDESVETGVDVDSEKKLIGEPYKLCSCCGIVLQGDADLPCDCGAQGKMVWRLEIKGETLRTCPSCGTQSSFGDVASRFLTGQDAPVSVLATGLYQMLPQGTQTEDMWGNMVSDQTRKLLVFSDSRQDAAFFAPYLERTYNQILCRRLILKTLEETEAFHTHFPRIQEVVDRLIDQARGAGLFAPEKGYHEQRKEAHTWMMQEMMPLDQRNSLEGVGLIDFRLVRPQNDRQPSILARPPWNLNPDEIWDLFQVLLNTLRLQAAVTFPEGVSPKDDAFSPRNREFFIRESGSLSKAGIYSWLPSGKGRSNRRLDFVVRLLQKRNIAHPEIEARKLLQGLWQNIFAKSGSPWSGILPSKQRAPEGVVYQLDHQYWEVVPRWLLGDDEMLPIYRCDRCGTLSRANVLGICPAYRCDGTLRVFQAETDPHIRDNHYRNLYQYLSPMALAAEEHTAQLSSQAAADLQERFMGNEVNVLSCSTTFELGVDVGELQAVLMRNMPPQTANYIQRAGRAGRRTDSTAFALTFAQRRSHDLTHYAEPDRFVSGKIHPPVITIANEPIVRRHLHSVALALFFRRYPDLFGDVRTFFEVDTGDGAAPKLLQSFLNANPQELGEALKRIVPEDMQDGLELDTWGWSKHLIGHEESRLDRVEAEVLGEIEELERLEKEAYDSKEGRKGDRYKRNAETIRGRNLLGFFGSRNVLPKYGFPVDVVPLEIRHHSDQANRIELDRDLRIAISEYAPGSQVVAAGRVWTSYGLKQVPNRGWPSYWYVVCPECSRYQSALTAEDLGGQCRVCGTGFSDSKTVPANFVIPEFGFVTGALEEPKRPGESRPPRSYASRAYFAEYARSDGGKNTEEIPLEPEGRWEPEAGMMLQKRYSRQGKLAMVNSGRAGRGFRVCDACGYAEPVEFGAIRSRKKNHRSPWGKVCNGTLSPYHLGHEFLTDVLELRFGGALPSRKDRRFWLSLTYALLEGASRALDIRREDIEGCLFPVGGEGTPPAIVLYDDVPGGAGHVRRIGNQLQEVLRSALDRVQDCECTEDTSCYECLRNYRNQWYHEDLVRGPVSNFLKHLLPAIYTEEGQGAYLLGVPDRGRWLARQIQQASEAYLFVPFLSLPGQNAAITGGQDWSEVLRHARNNGAQIKLVLARWPDPKESRQAEDAALLHELLTIQQRGVEVFLWPEEEPLPEWPIYIHEGGTEGFERLVRWKDVALGSEEGLSALTGRSDMEIMTEKNAVSDGRAYLEKMLMYPCQPVLEENLFASENNCLIRVKEGPTEGFSEYFSDWFTPEIVQVDIKDPYLRNANQLENLQALIELIKERCVPGQNSLIRVNVQTATPHDKGKERDYQRDKLGRIREHFADHYIDFQFKTFPPGHVQYKFHDREIRLKDRRQNITSILIGRGMDFISHRQGGLYASKTYIAIFSEKN
jgi:hypothetical protein